MLSRVKISFTCMATLGSKPACWNTRAPSRWVAKPWVRVMKVESARSARSTSACSAKGESMGTARKISSENSGSCSQAGSLTLSSSDTRMASSSWFFRRCSRSTLEPRVRSMLSSLRRSLRPMTSLGTVFTVSE
ncbi:hypothetical protein D3C81_1725100 [compost metagenome]